MVMLERRSPPPALDMLVGILAVAVLASDTVPLAQPQKAHGRVEGRVTFRGAPPPQLTVGETGDSQPRLYINPSGGLRYAVVSLPDARRTNARPPAAPAVVNQRNFIFEPQVLAIRTGRVVRFTSDDVANHNVRARGATPANTFFLSTAPGAIGAATHTFGTAAADRPVALSCDIHPWMAAWVYVFDHDAFAVTEANGTFHLDDIPPGRYRFAVRQPSGPLARDLAINIEAGNVTRLDVQFTSGDIRMPSR